MTLDEKISYYKGRITIMRARNKPENSNIIKKCERRLCNLELLAHRLNQTASEGE